MNERPTNQTPSRQKPTNMLCERPDNDDFRRPTTCLAVTRSPPLLPRSNDTRRARAGRHAPARMTETAKSYRRCERQVRDRSAGDIRGLPSAIAARETAPLDCVQRAELPVRTDVVCLPCAVNTCDNDSPSCHPSPRPCAASAKPNGSLLGKRDTAAQSRALPMNAAIGNFNAMAGKQFRTSLQRRPPKRSRDCALFGHRGFCRTTFASIQSLVWMPHP